MPGFPKTVKVHIDGCSKGNPGPAAAGFVMEDVNGGLLEEGSAPLGTATNNEAEYRALVLAMERCLARKVRVAYFFTDSELLTKQLGGAYKIRSARLSRLADRVAELRAKFESAPVAHVPRNLNRHADRLANAALKASLDGASSPDRRA